MGPVGQIAVSRRVYRLQAAQIGVFLAFAVGSVGMGALILLESAHSLHPGAPMVVSAGLAAFGLYMGLTALRSQMVFDGARLRVQGPIQAREFDLSQVEGYRTYQGRYGSYKVICLRDRAGTIPLTRFATDGWLAEWIAQLKDLDQRDEEQLLEKIDRDEELGATQGDRRSALGRAKRISIGMWVVDGAAAGLFLFGPEPDRVAAMAVVVLMPIAAAWLVYRQPLLYALFAARSDPRGNMSPALMISAIGLIFGAERANFVSIGLLMPFVVFGWLLSMAMYYPAARKSPRFATAIFPLCFLSAFYGWGLAASIDVSADLSAPQIYTAQVLGGYVSRGSRSTSYYLNLEPWGPYQANNSQMKVSATRFYATRQGDVVCLALHPGALFAPWYEAVACGSGPH